MYGDSFCFSSALFGKVGAGWTTNRFNLNSLPPHLFIVPVCLSVYLFQRVFYPSGGIRCLRVYSTSLGVIRFIYFVVFYESFNLDIYTNLFSLNFPPQYQQI